MGSFFYKSYRFRETLIDIWKYNENPIIHNPGQAVQYSSGYARIPVFKFCSKIWLDHVECNA